VRFGHLVSSEWELKLKRHKELKRIRLQRALKPEEEAEIRQLAQELVGQV